MKKQIKTEKMNEVEIHFTKQYDYITKYDFLQECKEYQMFGLSLRNLLDIYNGVYND